MQAVLVKDQDLGSIRNKASETEPLASAVNDYIAELDRIDFAKCSPEFTAAFRSHRDAWEATLPFLERFPELRGELHSVFEHLKAKPAVSAEIEALDKRIWETWAEVEAVVYATE